MDAYLGSPEDCDDIVNPKFLDFFEGGWGEASCFLFFTTVVEDGGSIGSGFSPEYFLLRFQCLRELSTYSVFAFLTHTGAETFKL